MTNSIESNFKKFEKRLQNKVLSHPIVTHNPYCQWFEQADLEIHDVRHFTVQFSVFSNQFLIAQLHKMINAINLEEMH